MNYIPKYVRVYINGSKRYEKRWIKPFTHMTKHVEREEDSLIWIWLLGPLALFMLMIYMFSEIPTREVTVYRIVE